MHAPQFDNPEVMETPRIVNSTATHTPQVDNPIVAAPGARWSAKTAHSEKKVNAKVKERDDMRAQVKDRILGCFGEYSWLFYVMTCLSFVLQVMPGLPLAAKSALGGQTCWGLPSGMV
jgi:hypothetical protein